MFFPPFFYITESDNSDVRPTPALRLSDQGKKYLRLFLALSYLCKNKVTKRVMYKIGVQRHPKELVQPFTF